MSTSAISHSGGDSINERAAIDIAAERLARQLLRWSENHATQRRPSHERMALIRDNERMRYMGGSPFAR